MRKKRRGKEVEKRGDPPSNTNTRARTTHGRKRATCSYSSSHYEKYAATKGWGLKRSGMCGVNWSIIIGSMNWRFLHHRRFLAQTSTTTKKKFETNRM